MCNLLTCCEAVWLLDLSLLFVDQISDIVMTVSFGGPVIFVVGLRKVPSFDAYLPVAPAISIIGNPDLHVLVDLETDGAKWRIWVNFRSIASSALFMIPVEELTLKFLARNTTIPLQTRNMYFLSRARANNGKIKRES